MSPVNATALRVSVAAMEDIQRARAPWNALVDCMRLPTIFLTWEWIVSWMETVAEGYCITILFVHDGDGALSAILPLAQKRGRVAGLTFPANVLTWCASLELYPDHLDLICAADADAAAILDVSFEFLRARGARADVCYFPFLAADGFLASYLLAGRAKGLTVAQPVVLESPHVELAGGYAAYLSAMSKKKRYNLARERKILCEEQKADFTVLESAAPLAAAIDTLFDLHAKRAGDKGLVSTFTGERIRRFHSLLASRLAGTERVRLYRLQVGEEVIATVYGFLFHREFAFYQAGFEPGWKKFSPGKVMIARVLEELAERGVILFDFLGGGDEYKQFWATGSRRMVSLLGFNATPLGLANRAAQALRRLRRLFRQQAMPQSLQR